MRSPEIGGAERECARRKAISCRRFGPPLGFPLLLLVGLLACDDPDAFDCVKRAGRPCTEIRPVAAFTHLIVEDNIDVYLNNGDSTVAVIETGENLIGKVRLEQTGDTLRIRNGNACNWVRNYQNSVSVTLGTAGLKGITHRGYGQVRSTEPIRPASLTIYILEANGNVSLDVRTPSVYLYTNCSPEVTLRGETENLGVWSREFGKILAENLRTRVCDIRNASANEIRVYPIRKLRAVIEQSGNILYFNRPDTMDVHISGTGKLIRK